MSSLDEIHKKVNRSYPGFVKSGYDLKDEQIPRIPFDIFILDLLTGGGVPEGKISMFYGNKSSSKSTIAYRVAGNYLRFNPGMKVLLADFEHSYDPSWAKHFIFDPKRFLVLRPDYGEQGVDIVAEYALSDEIGLIINDSAAMMISTAEADGAAGDRFMAQQAILLGSFFKKLIPIMSHAKRESKRLLTVIVINQTRVKFNAARFGAQDHKPCGRMQEFVVSLDLKFYLKEYKKVGGIPVRSVNAFTIEKNKVGLPKRSGEFSYFITNYDGNKIGEPDDLRVVVEYAKRVGLVKKEGNKWLLGKNHQFQSQLELVKFLEGNRQASDKLKSKTVSLCLDDVLLSAEAGEEGKDDVG